MQNKLNPDILENTLRRHNKLLDILLIDRTKTTKRKTHNILWATDSYQDHNPMDEIKIKDITGKKNAYLIQPRIAKTKEEQRTRTKDKAEVFTPTTIVDQMNKQTDWGSNNWPANEKNWQDYVKELRLEITCGEAPFIVGRYNVAKGRDLLDISERVGFLDRKLRVVSRYCGDDEKEWYKWAKIAFQSSYGYEWQGDNLLLARENLLCTFIEYWNHEFKEDEINLKRKVAESKMNKLLEIAEIISWNIFQMDGLKYVVPMSCKTETIVEENLLTISGDEEPKIHKKQCPGCEFNNITKHNGVYVKIMDWQKDKSVKFVDLFR